MAGLINVLVIAFWCGIIVIPIISILGYFYFSNRSKIEIERDLFIKGLKYWDDVIISVDEVNLELKVISVNQYWDSIKAYDEDTNFIVITSTNNIIYKRHGKAN